MIRSYSRPRHLMAGCTSPLGLCATKSSGLTTMPSPPLPIRLGDGAAREYYGAK